MDDILGEHGKLRNLRLMQKKTEGKNIFYKYFLKKDANQNSEEKKSGNENISQNFNSVNFFLVPAMFS